MSTDFDKLLDDDQVTAQRRGRVVDPAADNAPEYVRDSVHMKELISEVLERSKPRPRTCRSGPRRGTARWFCTRGP